MIDVDKVLNQAWNTTSKEVADSMIRVQAYIKSKANEETDMPLYDMCLCLGALESVLTFHKSKQGE